MRRQENLAGLYGGSCPHLLKVVPGFGQRSNSFPVLLLIEGFRVYMLNNVLSTYEIILELSTDEC